MSFILSHLYSYSQIPVLKVDLNISDREEEEVNEPGYIPWPINANTATKTIQGITFEFKNGGIDDDWYKAGIQAPNYARLVNDGLSTTGIELYISGLQKGIHSLVTFHNAVSNPLNNIYTPIDIIVNRQVLQDNIMETNRVLINDLATTAYIQFEVTNEDPVVIQFVPETPEISFMINGFHLNTSDPKKLVKFQYPEDKDEHVNIDNDTLVFRWKLPDNAVSQNIYFGKDESEVLLADPKSPQFVGNQTDTFLMKTGFYNMENYYWRVDPIDSKGDTTKGGVFYFKKRKQAFPGADGYGKYAIGGRGGKVVYVTNLDDNGPGSFRYAVENDSGPRTILFAVSGLITLSSPVVINDDYVTVAGQTAPGKGICFRWAPIGVTGHNLIVQNLRVRVGYGVTYDGMGLTGSESSIIDHCSISWSIDEGFSSRGAKNITFQRNLISEALNNADHDIQHSNHGYAGSIGGDIGSFHHNLLAHCEGRNWSMAGGLDGDGYYAGRLDLFNNFVYNWGGRADDGGAHEVNFVGNYYKKGPATTQDIILKADLEGTGSGTQSYFSEDNILENTDGSLACDGTVSSCSRTYTLSNGQILDWEVFVDQPFFPSDARIDSAKNAYKFILSDVGCTQPVFDDHDIRVVNETIDGTTSCNGSVTGKPGLPDREGDVGAWEAYPGFVRSDNWDTDLDGLPNWWEKAHSLDTNSTTGDFTESNADPDIDGYTRLEEYLQWMALPHYFIKKGENKEIDLTIYSRGFTNSPVFSVFDAANGTADHTPESSMVNFIPTDEGIAEFKFTVTDAEGTSMTRKIGFYVGQIPADSGFVYTYNLGRTGNATVTVDSVNHVYQPVTNKENRIPGILNITVYPNPANNMLNLDFISKISTVVELQVINVLGTISHQEKYQAIQGKNSLHLDITMLNPGLYMIIISQNGYNKTLSFIKN